ncbi:uncharacterized protein H6S33_006996 [Morchella sextelata]|uniref:uncharacterized protein n=1 Tax=Morchella sextelata TaxID=1174677 RepID=UPI001D03DEE6|nr:uncharacterized protein H6S33_006996 [Morchella sextelata]KAH0603965.1 hypothetical protein H6S33_006996 [Morchella sextelata]
MRPYWSGNYQDCLMQRRWRGLVNQQDAAQMRAVCTVLKQLFHAGEIFDYMFYYEDVFVVRLGEGWLDTGCRAVFEDIEVAIMEEVVEMVEVLVKSQNEMFGSKGGKERARGMKTVVLTMNRVKRRKMGEDDEILKQLKRSKMEEELENKKESKNEKEGEDEEVVWDEDEGKDEEEGEDDE